MRGARRAVALLSVLSLAALALPVPRYNPTPVPDGDGPKADAYLAAHGLPLPEGWQWHDFPFEGGELRWGMARAEENRGTLIFVPGFSNYIEAYAPFISAWHEAGFTVIAVDLPGQGGSTRRADNPEKPWTGDFSWYAKQLAPFVQARSAEARSPVTLVAESFGAHVTLRAIAEGRIHPSRTALIVPGLELKTAGMPPTLTKGFVSTATFMGFGSRYAPSQGQWAPKWHEPLGDYGCAKREDRVYHKDAVFTLRPDFRIGGITNEWAAGFDRSGQKLADGEALDRVQTRFLMVTAGKDDILDYARTEKVCTENLPHCELIDLPDAGHCLLFEPDEIGREMTDAVAAFALEAIAD